MVNKTKRYIVLAIITIITITIIIGYKIWNKPHQNIKDATALKATASALYLSLSSDSTRMKSTFVNKVVAVSGEVKQVAKNQLNQQIILLKTNIPDGSINCTMEEKVNDIKIGEPILLKGICSGFISGDIDMGLSGDVYLIRCYRSN
jgi:hypothetical protein